MNLLKAVAGLLLLAGPVAGQALPPAPPQPPIRRVDVRGTAEQEIEPEKLDLLLTYRFSDNVKESSRTQEQEQGLQQVLKQLHIAPDKLTLDELSAVGYGGFSKTGNANVGLVKTYRLTLDNPKLLNDLVPKLVLTGADNLRVVNLQSAQLAATRLDVAGRAVADARQKAQLVAKQAGGQLGNVLAVAEVLPGNSTAESLLGFESRGDKRKGSMGNFVDDPEIGTPNLRKIKVKAMYDVVFEIK
jgi:hypothetical protein